MGSSAPGEAVRGLKVYTHACSRLQRFARATGHLQELLGDLFIHPKSLQQEEMFGEGAYATVHKARCGAEACVGGRQGTRGLVGSLHDGGIRALA